MSFCNWYKEYNIPTQIKIYTSHYIGIYRTIINEQSVQINIRPRFGDAVFNYLMSFASDIYLPENAFSSYSQDQYSQPLWLMAILWKGAFDKAVSISHIPHDYVQCRENLSALKGRLDFQQHIRHNLVMQHRLYCQYFKYTADITINRVIRYTYKILSRHSGSLLGDAAAWDSKLAAFGVSDNAVTGEEVDNIVYTPMTESYRLLMEICKMLIEYENLSSTMEQAGQEGFSFFIDIAQIWENYIIHVLGKYMDKEKYVIESPNYEGEPEYLLEDNYRWIKPDILIKDKAGTVKAVLDAKYKFYKKLGKTAKDYYAVSREDLYQMTSYLLNYQHKNRLKDLLGLFVSPCEIETDLSNTQENGNIDKNFIKPDIKAYKNAVNIKIGVVNLPLPKLLDYEDASLEDKRQFATFFIRIIPEYEKYFVETLAKQID